MQQWFAKHSHYASSRNTVTLAISVTLAESLVTLIAQLADGMPTGDSGCSDITLSQWIWLGIMGTTFTTDCVLLHLLYCCVVWLNVFHFKCDDPYEIFGGVPW